MARVLGVVQARHHQVPAALPPRVPLQARRAANVRGVADAPGDPRGRGADRGRGRRRVPRPRVRPEPAHVTLSPEFHLLPHVRSRRAELARV